MVFNATFNNIQLYHGGQFYWCRKTGVPGENHRPAASHWQTLSHNVVSSTLSGVETNNVSGDRHWLHRYLYIQPRLRSSAYVDLWHNWFKCLRFIKKKKKKNSFFTYLKKSLCENNKKLYLNRDSKSTECHYILWPSIISYVSKHLPSVWWNLYVCKV